MFFSLFYNERINCKTFGGICVLIAGVFCVSLKSTERNDRTQIVPEALYAAIFFSFFAGFFISFNSMVMRTYTKEALFFSPIQLNIDGVMTCGCLLAAGFFMSTIDWTI